MARKAYAKPGTTWILVTQAAQLMGCAPFTAFRRLRPHIAKKLCDGRIRNCVLLSRVREAAVTVAEEPGETPADIREIRAQIKNLERRTIVLAKGLGKLSGRLRIPL